jgi:hypothetical protein
MDSNEHVSITFPKDENNLMWARTVSALGQLRSDSLTIDVPVNEINVGPIIEVPTGPVIVAGIGALSAALGAILTFLSRVKEGRVVIKGKDGATVDVPKDVSKEDLEYYISKAKELSATDIQVFRT